MTEACFPAETLILCRDGFKPIIDVAIGDAVLTHMGRWRAVTACSTGTIYSVRLRGMGHPGLYTSSTQMLWAIRTTRKWQPRSSEHPRGSHQRYFAPPTWLPVHQSIGAYWASPAAVPALPIPPMEVKDREHLLDTEHPSLWWLVGAWLGRGSLTENQRYHRNSDIIDTRIRIPLSVPQLFQVNEHMALLGLPEVRNDTINPCLHISSQSLFCWMATHFGRGTSGKRLPVWSLGAPAPLRQALLDGFLAIEGEPVYRGIRVASVNQCLLLGIKLLAQTLERSAIWYINAPHTHHEVAGKPIYGMRPIGHVSLNPESRSVEIGLHRFAKVRSIEPIGMVRSGYALHVADDESYVADGIVVKSLPA